MWLTPDFGRFRLNFEVPMLQYLVPFIVFSKEAGNALKHGNFPVPLLIFSNFSCKSGPKTQSGAFLSSCIETSNNSKLAGYQGMTNF